MSDSEPPDGDGQSQPTQHRNGGSLARLRNLLRLLRRPASRGPEAAMEAMIAAAASMPWRIWFDRNVSFSVMPAMAW